MADRPMFPEDVAISLNALFGLSGALSPYVRAEDRIGALRVVLGWCADQGFLKVPGVPTQEQFDHMAQLCAQAQEKQLVMHERAIAAEAEARALWEAVEAHNRAADFFLSGSGSVGILGSGGDPTGEQLDAVVQRLKDEEIPAGPQALPGKPDPKAAGDLNAVADRPGYEVEAPMGGEARDPGADDPPATPVAGGVASPPGGLPPLWTEEEDRRAIEMRVSGCSVNEVAAALGRPLAGTRFRIYKVLKARIAEAQVQSVPTRAALLDALAERRARIGQPDEQAVSSAQDPAEDPGAGRGT